MKEECGLNKKEILRLIKMAKIDMDNAREAFNSFDEPKLLEMAIYEEKAASSKIEYLLDRAKEEGIKLEPEDIYLLSCKII